MPRSGIPFVNRSTARFSLRSGSAASKGGAFPACFRVARSQPGTTRPREAPPLSLNLSYLNDCVIISRALISSPQGGYMVQAARTATPSAPAPIPTRHFLIGYAAIKNARNSPESNALHFSNRLKRACLRAPSSRVLRPKNHESPVADTARASPLTNHYSPITHF